MFPVTVKFGSAAHGSLQYRQVIGMTHVLARPELTELVFADVCYGGYSRTHVLPVKMADMFNVLSEAKKEGDAAVADLTWETLREKNLLSPPAPEPEASASRSKPWLMRLITMR